MGSVMEGRQFLSLNLSTSSLLAYSYRWIFGSIHDLDLTLLIERKMSLIFLSEHLSWGPSSSYISLPHPQFLGILEQ